MNTYEQRITTLKNALDINKQIACAEREARAYRKKANQTAALEDKLTLKNDSEACRLVAQKLRVNYFALIETMGLVYPTAKAIQSL